MFLFDVFDVFDVSDIFDSGRKKKTMLQTREYRFTALVAAHAELLFARSPFWVGWCPAQHDTQSISIIATINNEANE